MIDKVYLKYIFKSIMPYNQTTVVLGGIMHIPIIIGMLRFIENRFKKNELNYKNN